MPFNFIKHLKLSTRIIIALSTIVSAIFVTQTAYNLHHNNEERLNSLYLRATLLAASQADALAGLIWDYDQKRASGNLIGITQDPEVIDAEIIDDTGRIFANFSMLKLSDAKRSKISKRNAKSIIKVKQKIVFTTEEGRKRNLGHITIFMTTDRINSAFWNDLISSAFIAFIILTIIIIGLSITISSFTKPIMMMSSIMRQRLIGDYSGDVDDNYMMRDDEIGDIAKSIEADQKNRRDELKLLKTTRAIATELNLDNLLAQIIGASTELLDAERSTLYLFDAESDTLWTRVAEGIGDHVIRLKSNEGIAGSVFQTGKAEIVLDPSSDDRWEKQISEDLGFNVKNILSMPITNKSGQKIGVTQVLNKKNGIFSNHDIERMASLNAQTSAAIENAQLFESVLKMRNYNESILGSLTNGVISLDRDFKIQKINAAAQEIMNLSKVSRIEQTFEDIIGNNNLWITELLSYVVNSGRAKQIMDDILNLPSGGKIEVNLVITPLQSIEDSDGGYLIIFEDISEEKRVRGAMSRYVSPKIVDQLLESDGDKLEGTSQVATILFTDIRSFTSISESIGAKQTVAMLNEYFSEMVDMIQKNDGILDKFIGDAIMAAFGIPFTSGEDANNAVTAVYEMSSAMKILNVKREARGDIPIRMGMGINTGEVVVGNIGSSKRMNYTVIGDAVNLAARLEGATKFYKTDILISEFTFNLLGLEEKKLFRSADLLRVKGKSDPVKIFEALPKGSPKIKFLDFWETGISAFKRQSWEEAKKIFLEFDSAISLNNSNNTHKRGGDPLASIYVDRINNYIESPPPDNWDGVFVMNTK